MEVGVRDQGGFGRVWEVHGGTPFKATGRLLEGRKAGRVQGSRRVGVGVFHRKLLVTIGRTIGNYRYI